MVESQQYELPGTWFPVSAVQSALHSFSLFELAWRTIASSDPINNQCKEVEGNLPPGSTSISCRLEDHRERNRFDQPNPLKVPWRMELHH